MHKHRLNKVKKKQAFKSLKDIDLCNGPSKLCISMDIHKDNCNKLNLCDNDLLWLESSPNFNETLNIVTAKRIGIDSAGEEWANKPLRFYIFGNPHVSKRNRTAEKLIELPTT